MKVIAIAGGIAVAGAVTGLLIGILGDGSPSTFGGGAAVVDCPAGDHIDTYAEGSRVFAVARSDDSYWVQVRSLARPQEPVWVSASSVELDEDLSSLPVASCRDEDSSYVVEGGVPTTTTTLLSTTTTIAVSTTTTTTTTTIAVSTTTTTQATTTTTARVTTTSSAGTTTPTSPPATTTTIPPDTTAPTIVSATALPNKIWEEFPNLCTGLDKHADIDVVATDTESGVERVEASWVIEGNQTVIDLTRSGDMFSGQFGPFPYLTIPDGDDQIIDITLTAIDNEGNWASVVRQVRLHSAGTCNQ